MVSGTWPRSLWGRFDMFRSDYVSHCAWRQKIVINSAEEQPWSFKAFLGSDSSFIPGARGAATWREGVLGFGRKTRTVAGKRLSLGWDTVEGAAGNGKNGFGKSLRNIEEPSRAWTIVGGFLDDHTPNKRSVSTRVLSSCKSEVKLMGRIGSGRGGGQNFGSLLVFSMKLGAEPEDFSRRSVPGARGLSMVAEAGKDMVGLGRKKVGSKSKVHWVCENCGESYSQWWGECKNCKEMNTLKQFREQSSASGKGGGAAARAVGLLGSGSLRKVSEGVETQGAVNSPRTGGRAWLENVGGGPQRLADVAKGHSQLHWRLPLPGDTGKEVARVLGGGLVPGSLILVGGDPGVGKSTLLLQLAGIIAEGSEAYGPAPVLYVSGEESVEQISSRANRLNISAHDLFLYSATDLELVLEAIQELEPRAVIVDSIQTVYLPEANGSAGSVSQVRECATAMLRAAKQTGIPIFLVGHVTKSGDIAGPKILEHVVDVVLYMEGERLQSHRLLRVVKNRYGSTDEVGVFEMVEGGLAAVESPSELFLSARNLDTKNVAAAAVAVTMEGSRPILLEVQALCSMVGQGPGRRTANGVDGQRLSLLLAVLTKQASLKLANQDVFVNVVGGLQLREPAADVAIAVAICSSYLEKDVERDMAFIGEIGLGGELRSVGQLERRLSEAAKLGFKRCVIPKSAAKSSKGFMSETLVTIPCSDVKEVIERLFVKGL